MAKDGSVGNEVRNRYNDEAWLGVISFMSHCYAPQGAGRSRQIHGVASTLRKSPKLAVSELGAGIGFSIGFEKVLCALVPFSRSNG